MGENFRSQLIWLFIDHNKRQSHLTLKFIDNNNNNNRNYFTPDSSWFASKMVMEFGKILFQNFNLNWVFFRIYIPTSFYLITVLIKHGAYSTYFIIMKDLRFQVHTLRSLINRYTRLLFSSKKIFSTGKFS